ncbi:hypothetical protein PV04_09195 [Phialophora macrospora]|uniref:Uncharacterized protein n=1 Tax=Phialophora macrospora TaxID=1851006 RepID=A0A0D2F8A0_9EURO|nr:hypothetical protein PV04_09195 [Phialophora macrospora]
MFRAIWLCINAGRDDDVAVPTETKWADEAEKGPDTTPDAALAQRIITAMQGAEKTGEELRTQVADVVQINGWTESLAKAVLARLDDGIKTGMVLKGPLKDAFDKAVTEAAQFARDHPVWTTLIALGILAVLLPWVIEALGFGARGPIARTFAAWWQSKYAGYVPKESLFSFFQRLGMKWKYVGALL